MPVRFPPRHFYQKPSRVCIHSSRFHEGSLSLAPESIGKRSVLTRHANRLGISQLFRAVRMHTAGVCTTRSSSLSRDIKGGRGRFKKGELVHVRANASHCSESSLPASYHVLRHFCYCSCSSPASDLLPVCAAASCYQDGACQGPGDLWQFRRHGSGLCASYACLSYSGQFGQSTSSIPPALYWVCLIHFCFV